MRTFRILVAGALAALLLSPAAVARADELLPDVPATTESAAPAEPTAAPAGPPVPEQPAAPATTEEAKPKPDATSTPIPANAKAKSAAVAEVVENHAPVAVDDSYQTVQDTPISVDLPGVLANDTDADGDDLSVTLFTASPNSDSNSVAANGSFTYDPKPDFTGMDAFDYTISDGHGGSDGGTITVFVKGNVKPHAVDDHITVSTTGRAALKAPGVLANDFDFEDDPLTVSSSSSFSHAQIGKILPNGTFDYLPEPGWVGTDTATYRVTDDHGNESDPATITVVTSVNAGPTIVDDSFTVEPGRTLVIHPSTDLIPNDTDPEGDNLSLDTIGFPEDHTDPESYYATDELHFTPEPGFLGTTSGNYGIVDTFGNRTTGMYSITVAPKPHVAPVAVDDAYTVVAGETLTVDAPGVLGNDTDADGDALNLFPLDTFHHAASQSVLPNGSFTYVAEDGFTGTDTATYSVLDAHGGVSEVASIRVTVTPKPNAAPVAVDDHYTVVEGEELTVDAPGYLANDTDADGDTVSGFHFTAFDHGSYWGFIANGSFYYAPEDGFTGDDTVQYQMQDSHGNPSNMATITITVLPAPVTLAIVDDEYAVGQDETLTVDAPGVLGNDVVPDGSSLGPCTNAAHGTATCHADGSFTFTPHAGFSGDASFVYAVNGPVAPAFVRAAELEPNQGLVTIHVAADETATPTDPADPATPSGGAATLPDTGAGLPPSFPVLGGMLILAGLMVLRQARRLS